MLGGEAEGWGVNPGRRCRRAVLEIKSTVENVAKESICGEGRESGGGNHALQGDGKLRSTDAAIVERGRRSVKSCTRCSSAMRGCGGTKRVIGEEGGKLEGFRSGVTGQRGYVRGFRVERPVQQNALIDVVSYLGVWWKKRAG